MLPDVEQSADVFIAMATQWRTGARGATGLDYSPLPFVMRTRSVPRAEQAAVFDDLRVMEAEALKVMSEHNA